MNTTIEQDIEKKRSKLLKSDFNKYIFDKNKITKYPKGIWFKGSRHR